MSCITIKTAGLSPSRPLVNPSAPARCLLQEALPASPGCLGHNVSLSSRLQAWRGQDLFCMVLCDSWHQHRAGRGKEKEGRKRGL